MEDKVPALCPICGDTLDWCSEWRRAGTNGHRKRRTPEEIVEAWVNMGTAQAPSLSEGN
jgi:hypothetical protein